MIDPERERRVLDAALRERFPSFLRKVFDTLSPGQTFEGGWVIEAMAHHIDHIQSGEERRLIVNLPPRSLKSITFSVALPAYLLGHRQRLRIICVSYSGDLAKKLAFGIKIEDENVGGTLPRNTERIFRPGAFGDYLTFAHNGEDVGDSGAKHWVAVDHGNPNLFKHPRPLVPFWHLGP